MRVSRAAGAQRMRAAAASLVRASKLTGFAQVVGTAQAAGGAGDALALHGSLELGV
jgi:hypothetical protein